MWGLSRPTNTEARCPLHACPMVRSRSDARAWLLVTKEREKIQGPCPALCLLGSLEFLLFSFFLSFFLSLSLSLSLSISLSLSLFRSFPLRVSLSLSLSLLLFLSFFLLLVLSLSLALSFSAGSFFFSLSLSGGVMEAIDLSACQHWGPAEQQFQFFQS